MVAAAAVGPIVLGDKESPWKTDSICSSHVPDVVELDADDHGAGGDTIYEIKVPTPLKKKHAAGVGTRAHGGAAATVGHLYGFGSTEEEYTLLIQGCGQRGRRADGPFKHDTGKGFVEARPGQYHGRAHNCLVASWSASSSRQRAASRAQRARKSACWLDASRARTRATVLSTGARAAARAFSTCITRA